MTGAQVRPIVLVTGAAGNLGRSVAAALADGYWIVGLDRQARGSEEEAGPAGSYPIFAVDLGSDESVASALEAFRNAHGARIASVVHLAAYFDFTGEENHLYQSVNVDGTRRLSRAPRRAHRRVAADVPVLFAQHRLGGGFRPVARS